MVDGKWTATHKGADYFKHNQDSYKVEYPVRQVWVSSKVGSRDNLDKPEKNPEKAAYYVEPDTRDAYSVARDVNDNGIGDDDGFTVGKLKLQPLPRRLPNVMTAEEQEAKVRVAAASWIALQQSILGYDLTTDMTTPALRRRALLLEWYVVLYDSDCFWVYDPTRVIRVTIIRFNFHSRLVPTSNTVMTGPCATSSWFRTAASAPRTCTKNA